MNAFTNSESLAPAAADTVSSAQGQELMYRFGESLFAAVSNDMVSRGWSIFPQERSGDRKPGTVNGTVIAWSADHDLKNNLPSPKALKLWNENLPSLNVACVFGPASGNSFAVDIDILDATFSAEIEQMAVDMLGDTPFRRVGMAPKIALIYRQSEGGERRVRSQSFHFAENVSDGKGGTKSVMSEHGLEILSDGKLLTFHGLHHKTGCYFTWSPKGSPIMRGPELAPEVSVEQVEAFIKAVQARHPAWKAPSYSGNVVYGDASGVRVPVLKEYKRGKSGLVEDGREAMLSDLVYSLARGNGFQILEAAEQGETALLALIGKLAAAASVEFVKAASLEGSRWTGQGLANEISRKVAHVVRKVARGDIRPAAIVAADRDGETPEVLAARRAETKDLPYAPLGADQGTYYFIDLHCQVRSFSSAALEKTATLHELADPEFWLTHYGTEKGGVNAILAGQALMKQARAVGVYDGGDIMGRGAWWIQEQPLFHDGNRILWAGKEHRPGHVGGKTFMRGKSLGVAGAKPLSADDAGLLVDLCNRWEWRSQTGMSQLAAAAIASATVCGALPWRTHYMISAEAGSGKSEFMILVNRILGSMAVDAMGDSTAKGLAQHLKTDALAIVMDEPESQTESDRANTKALVNFFRKASTETGAKTFKGTTDHKGTTFSNHCMGILAAITNPIVDAADLTRWVPLDMIVRADEATRKVRFQETQKMLAAIPADFGPRLLARMLGLLPVIRANTDTFGAAIAKNGGTGRMGRNLGVPLAVAHALKSDSHVSEEEAVQILKSTSWISETVQDTKVTPEWANMLAYLGQHRVDITFPRAPTEYVTLNQAVGILAGMDDTFAHEYASVRDALGRCGIRVDGRGQDATVHLANDSKEVAAALRGTAWSTGWAKTLERAEGAGKGKVRFTTTWQTRSATVPALVFLGLERHAEIHSSYLPQADKVRTPLQVVG